MKVKSLELFGFFGAFALGILLYFAYELSNESQFVALVAPVNNSIWEQLKIPFFSILLYGVIVYLFAKGEFPNILFAKVISAVVTSLFALMMYFGYTAIMDQHIFLDLLVLLVAIVLGQFLSLGILNVKGHVSGFNFVGLILLLGIMMTFATYTYEPPTHELFKDAETNTYGLGK